jgi:hypothetical protein
MPTAHGLEREIHGWATARRCDGSGGSGEVFTPSFSRPMDLTLQPVRVRTGSEDERGLLVFAGGALAAVLEVFTPSFSRRVSRRVSRDASCSPAAARSRRRPGSSVPPPASTTHRGKLGGKLGEKSSA